MDGLLQHIIRIDMIFVLYLVIIFSGSFYHAAQLQPLQVCEVFCLISFSLFNSVESFFGFASFYFR